MNRTMRAAGKGESAVALVAVHGWVGVSTPVVMTALFLAHRGYQVDLFVEEKDKFRNMGLSTPDFHHHNIRIIEIPPVSRGDGEVELFNNEYYVSRTVLEQIEGLHSPPAKYRWIVGFDPEGLLRAGLFSHFWDVPFIYHSLEIDEQESIRKTTERILSERALFILTQDESRMRVLAQVNSVGLEKIRVSCNSTMGVSTSEKQDYFRQKFNIPRSRTVVLATGTLLPITCVDEIVYSVDLWPDRFVLVLHGWIPDEVFFNKIMPAINARRGKIYFSDEILPPERKDTIFQSADIGLAFYRPDDLNLKYAAGSAGKIFDFMKASVPVIANNIPGMKELIVDNGCGVTVENAGEIAGVFADIVKNYDQLSLAAGNCFGKYEFGNCYEKLLLEIERETSFSVNASAS